MGPSAWAFSVYKVCESGSQEKVAELLNQDQSSRWEEDRMCEGLEAGLARAGSQECVDW